MRLARGTRSRHASKASVLETFETWLLYGLLRPVLLWVVVEVPRVFEDSRQGEAGMEGAPLKPIPWGGWEG